MKKKGMVFLTGVLGFLLVFGGLMPVYAQTSKKSKNANEFTLQTITVTAEKRTEDVQKTPVAITAITGAAIRQQAQVTLHSVLENVPALQIQKSPQGGQIYIRGIGSNGDSNWIDPDVTISLDNVYSGRAETVFTAMYDLDRIEVLRGPQGTLYGRNALGGTINVHTKNPSFNKVEGITNFQAGDYSLYHFDGALNVPVNDKFAFRVAALREHRDGYYTNGGREANLTGARAKFLYKSGALSMLLTADYFNEDQLDNTTVAFAHSDGPPFFQWQMDPDNSWFVDSLHPADRLKATFETFSLKIDYDFGWATATILPSYSFNHRTVTSNLFSGLFNAPGAPPYTMKWFMNNNTSIMDENQYTVDARLNSPSSSATKWVAGVYYLHDKNQPTGNGSAGGGPTNYTTYGNNRPADSYAVYGQMTYPLTHRLRLVAGLRYSKDKKTLAYGIKSTTIPGYNTGLRTADESYDAVTYKAGLQYDVTSRSMLYAQVATGYKAGGFDTSATPPRSYDPEHLTAYEIGSKNRFFNERLQLNADAYLYSYDKFQVQYPLNEAVPLPAGYIPSGGDTTQFAQYVDNAAGSQFYGMDLEVKALVTPHDEVDLTAALEHARYGHLVLFQNAAPPPGSYNAPGEPITLTGKPVANTPDWSFTVGYQHTFDLYNGGAITAQAQSKISGGYYCTTEEELENAWQDNYTRTSANVTYNAPNDVWSLSVWVKNIENDYQKTTLFPLYRMMITDPRTWGVNFTRKW